MSNPIQRFAKIGVVLATSFPEIQRGDFAVDEAAALIATDTYFTALELGSVPEPLRDRVRSICRSSNLSIAFTGGPTLFARGLSLSDSDPTARKSAIDAMKRCIDEAIFFGAEQFTVVSGPDQAPEHRSIGVDSLLDSLLQLCAYSAENGGPPIDLETFDREVERRRLIGPTSVAVDLANRVREAHPSFGILLDISHLPLLDESLEGAISLAKNVLVHMHLGNCVKRDRRHPAFGDSHPRLGVPWGENGLPELVATLRELLRSGFLGSGRKPLISFEVKPQVDESPLMVIASSKRSLDTAWWTVAQ